MPCTNVLITLDISNLNTQDLNAAIALIKQYEKIYLSASIENNQLLTSSKVEQKLIMKYYKIVQLIKAAKQQYTNVKLQKKGELIYISGS